MIDDEAIVLVGLVGAPFGVNGWAHVRSYTDPPENLLGYLPWQLSRDAATNAGWTPLDVEAARHGDGLIARFSGAGSREEAVELRGCGIGVPASVLPPPDEGEYYWRDLIGADVVNRTGESLGQVSRLMATPAHDVLVVLDDLGERLIPFVDEWVLAVVPESRRVVVDWESDWR